MARTTSTRTYGKRATRSTAERLFAELPQSPVRKGNAKPAEDDISAVTGQLAKVEIKDDAAPPKDKPTKKPATKKASTKRTVSPKCEKPEPAVVDLTLGETEKPAERTLQIAARSPDKPKQVQGGVASEDVPPLTWADVCPLTDRIDKIAEASYAEVYRITNERGTSIIKVIRLDSPIKPQTKAQTQSGLVDEEPHSEDDVQGELQISEWLADIPGFVIYKERYIVQGKATKGLLETHQKFQRRMKRQDPGRAQFYPSPSRYLPTTKFLVVELGDAGKALEDWELKSESQLWDIFFLEAIALARAEDMAMFEHRDLHEGNLCIKQSSKPRARDPDSINFFGHSGLDITILDYGLSRAEDLSIDFAKPVAFDLEKDLSLFTSTHASQCDVYRRMRSYLMGNTRKCLPPEEHDTPYPQGVDGPLSWDAYAPYTNVLWLAYLYKYMVAHFAGDPAELLFFRKQTKQMWRHLNPDAKETVPCFGSAADVVCFAVEAGWIREDQIMGAGSSMLEREDSIISVRR
ncbi:hypothetical protein N3K66_002691 [Trichothecium roseum]|uniref:Uncharacterized protein n=1 Tax=Trichothecium roseum TaxID=47278 RepID=A0ACC0VAC4_9HYPO|nr:hypothetical protein N3K66_002691 [Trichothecium roseum]